MINIHLFFVQNGELGIGSIAQQLSPMKIAVENAWINKIFAGAEHSFFSKNDGAMYSFGLSSVWDLIIY